MKICMCLAAQFADSRINGGSTISIKSTFMKIVFFLCAFSKSDVSSKNSSVGSIKLSTLLCWPREKRAEERKVRSKPALRLKGLRYHMPLK